VPIDLDTLNLIVLPGRCGSISSLISVWRASAPISEFSIASGAWRFGERLGSQFANSVRATEPRADIGAHPKRFVPASHLRYAFLARLTEVRRAMRLRVTIFALLPAVLAGAPLAQLALGGQLRTTAPATSLDPRTVDARADAWAKSFGDAGDFSGVVLIAQGDNVLLQRAYGKADPQLGTPNRMDTRFRTASISKTLRLPRSKSLSRKANSN